MELFHYMFVAVQSFSPFYNLKFICLKYFSLFVFSDCDNTDLK